MFILCYIGLPNKDLTVNMSSIRVIFFPSSLDLKVDFSCAFWLQWRLIDSVKTEKSRYALSV